MPIRTAAMAVSTPFRWASYRSITWAGDRMRFGRNSIEVEYVPLSVQGDMLKPQMHIKISSTGGDRKVLGEWRIEETVAGRKSFDLDVPQ